MPQKESDPERGGHTSTPSTFFFLAILAAFLAAFNTPLASLAIFSTLLRSLRASFPSLPSVSFWGFLRFLDSTAVSKGEEEEDRRFLLGGNRGREGAESRKPTGVEEVDVEGASQLCFVDELGGVILSSSKRGKQRGSVRPCESWVQEREQNVRSPSTTSRPFPFLPAPTSSSTGKEEGMIRPFINWAYNPLLAASRLAALMAVRLRADPAPKERVLAAVAVVLLVVEEEEEEVDCCDA